MKNRMQSKHNRGFTVVETLAVVAIIVILMAVSAVPAAKYVDTLKIMELDNAARDIYMAAQNRAVLLSGEGSQRLSGLVKRKDETDPTKMANLVTLTNMPKEGSHDGEKNYYISKADLKDEVKALLPTGSIDETLRDGDFEQHRAAVVSDGLGRAIDLLGAVNAKGDVYGIGVEGRSTVVYLLGEVDRTVDQQVVVV